MVINYLAGRRSATAHDIFMALMYDASFDPFRQRVAQLRAALHSGHTRVVILIRVGPDGYRHIPENVDDLHPGHVVSKAIEERFEFDQSIGPFDCFRLKPRQAPGEGHLGDL